LTLPLKNGLKQNGKLLSNNIKGLKNIFDYTAHFYCHKTT